jgi:hypothetical protein
LKTAAFNALHVPFDLNHAQLPHRSDNHRADRLAAALQIGADVAGVRGVLGVEWAKQSSAGATKKKTGLLPPSLCEHRRTRSSQGLLERNNRAMC